MRKSLCVLYALCGSTLSRPWVCPVRPSEMAKYFLRALCALCGEFISP